MIEWIKMRKGLFLILGFIGLYLLSALFMRRYDLIFLPFIRFQNLITVSLVMFAFMTGGFYWIKDAKVIPDFILFLPVFIIVLPLLLLGLGDLDYLLHLAFSVLIILSILEFFKENKTLWLISTLALSVVIFIVSFDSLFYFGLLFLYAIIAFIKLYYKDDRLQKILASTGLIMPLFFLLLIAMFSADQWIKSSDDLAYKTVTINEEEALVMVEQISVLISGTIYLEYYEPVFLGFYKNVKSTLTEGYQIPSLSDDNLSINVSGEETRIRLENEDLELLINP